MILGPQGRLPLPRVMRSRAYKAGEEMDRGRAWGSSRNLQGFFFF